MEVRKIIKEQIHFLKEIQKQASGLEACTIAMAIVELAEKLEEYPTEIKK